MFNDNVHGHMFQPRAHDNIRIWHNRPHTQRSGATNQSALNMPLPRCNASAPDVAPKASMRQRLCAKPEVRAALSAASVPVLWSRDLVRSQKRFMNEKPFAASKFEPFIEQLPRNSLMSSAWPDGCEMCDTCAVVGASGSLRKFEHGAQIDGHSLVLRPNWIINKGFEKNVGTRTSINVFFGVEGMMKHFERHQRSVPEERRAIGLITSNSHLSVSSFFRYLIRVHKSTALNKTATAAETLVTPSRVFLITDSIYHKALAEICRATGEGCMWQRTSGTMRPSTGFISVIIALQICRNVSLFGLTDDPRQPFHYYGEPKATCTKAIPTKNDEPLHWFEKEHEIYARWHREGRLTVYS